MQVAPPSGQICNEYICFNEYKRQHLVTNSSGDQACSNTYCKFHFRGENRLGHLYVENMLEAQQTQGIGYWVCKLNISGWNQFEIILVEKLLKLRTQYHGSIVSLDMFFIKVSKGAEGSLKFVHLSPKAVLDISMTVSKKLLALGDPAPPLSQSNS